MVSDRFVSSDTSNQEEAASEPRSGRYFIARKAEFVLI